MASRGASTPRRAAGTLPAVRVDQVIPSLASRDAIGVHTLTLTEALRDGGHRLGHLLRQLHTRRGRARATRSSSSAEPAATGGCSTSPPSAAPSSTSSPPGPSRSSSTTTTSPRPPCSRRWEPQRRLRGRRSAAPSSSGWPPKPTRRRRLGLQRDRAAEAGYTNTAVVPLLIDMTATGADPDPELAGRLAAAKERGGADLLFVGKISPHKAPHDLVKMLAVYRRLYDPSRPALAGRVARWATRYGPAAGRPSSTSSASTTRSPSPARSAAAELEAYYQAADVFVCASDHEGFCVPLVEAMGHGVPVVAYGVAAVPETVGRRRVGPARQGAAAVRRRRPPGGHRRRPPRPAGRRRGRPGRQLLGRAVDRPVRPARPPGRRRLTGTRHLAVSSAGRLVGWASGRLAVWPRPRRFPLRVAFEPS